MSTSNKILTFFLLILSAVIILRNAWVGDDSYIGFRTVYNFVNGFGLTFNINERVQSFTNPLWILLMSFFYVFTGEAYYTTIFLSLGVSLILLYVLAEKISIANFNSLLIFSLILSSKAFIDYSTSGLENPLGHLFLVLFAYVYLKEIRIEKRLFYLSLFSALAAVNRLDNILLYIFPIFVECLRFFSVRRALIMAAGFLPLIMWEIFSLVYYGFLFPNTYYAKLNTDISSGEYIAQGFRYLVNSLSLDPLTLLTIVFSLVIVGGYSYKYKKFYLLPLLGSIIIYLIYTFKVGGDFMSGRFLTYPFLLSIIVLSQVNIAPRVQIALAGLVVFFAVLSPYSPITANHNYRRSDASAFNEVVRNEGVADERAWYYYRTGFLHLSSNLEIIKYEKALDKVLPQGDSIVIFEESPVELGFNSYAAGPNVYLLNHMGLSDVLTARLPRDKARSAIWRIGHIWRRIPDGYVESLQKNKNLLTDKNIALYYDKILTIIRGDIFNLNRFATIYNMNTGKYDYLINKDLYSSVEAPVGQTIWLKGSNNQYVTTDNSNAYLTTNRSSVGAMEKFRVVGAGDGKIALINNNRYISAENGNAPLIRNRISLGDWEKYDWITNEDGTISLRGSNNLYISSENGLGTMFCNKPSIGDWEKFTYSKTSP